MPTDARANELLHNNIYEEYNVGTIRNDECSIFSNATITAT